MLVGVPKPPSMPQRLLLLLSMLQQLKVVSQERLRLLEVSIVRLICLKYSPKLILIVLFFTKVDDDEFSFQNPTSREGDIQVKQPKLLTCTLKEYQLKGLNWLANLYEQGINGILADEMVSVDCAFRY